MQPARLVDFGVALAACVPSLVFVSLRGDPLYLGLWYYIVVPAVLLIVAACLRPPLYLVAGIGVGTAVTFIPYWYVQMTAARPEGLLGLGHLFGLPGVALGTVASVVLARRSTATFRLAPFLIGLTGCLAGFALGQLVICNTLMWCGPILSAALSR